MSAVSINATGSLLAALEKNPGAYSWGHIYKGTERELVAAGLIKPDWLPGRGDNAKWRQSIVLSADGDVRLVPPSRRSRDPKEGEIVLRITPSGKTRFEVWKILPPSEQARRREEFREEHELERLKMELKAIEEREKEPKPPQAWAPDEFRRDLKLTIEFLRGMVTVVASGEKCAWGKREIPAHKLADAPRGLVLQKLSEVLAIVEDAKIEPINHAATARPTLTLVKG